MSKYVVISGPYLDIFHAVLVILHPKVLILPLSFLYTLFLWMIVMIVL